MVIRADPQRLSRTAREPRRGARGDEGPEGADARVRRGRGTEDRAAHQRMDAVGADHHVRFGAVPVDEVQPQRAVAVVQADAPATELDAPRGHLGFDDAEQVRAVGGVRVLAVEPFADGQVLAGQHRPVRPAAELPADVQPHAAFGATTRPAPTSVSRPACSYTVLGSPWRRKNAAVARPPMPPPTIAIRGTEVVAPVMMRP